MNPLRRISLIVRPQKAIAEANRCEAYSSDRGRRQGPGVEVTTFDEKKRVASCFAQTADLCPESPHDDTRVEISDTFPFNENLGSDRIVPDGQTLDRHGRTKLLEHLRDAAPSLKNGPQ
jgi:hypothetical protein